MVNVYVCTQGGRKSYPIKTWRVSLDIVVRIYDISDNYNYGNKNDFAKYFDGE